MTNIINLNRGNLASISAKGVATPNYRPFDKPPAIVHIGVGGFHRAHMAKYCDLLLNEQSGYWHICGIGIMPQDTGLKEKLSAQDYLYSLIELSEASDVSIIGSISDFVLATQYPDKALERLSAPETKIISLTITESGYPFNPANGGLQLDNPQIAHDIQNPTTPTSAFGYLLYGLILRMHRGLCGLTILSCDNLPHNGDVTQAVLLGFAEHYSEELVEWITTNVTFPNSMVDRITPATTEHHIEQHTLNTGIHDSCPVVSEAFSMWVLEDKFCQGRPSWEKVGATFTNNVTPFETMKLSLLNATHSAMAYLGHMMGLTYSYEAIENPVFFQLLTDFMNKDVTPILPLIPNVDIDVYKSQLIARFGNRHCADLLTRLCFDGSGKLPQFIIPSVEIMLDQKADLHRVALIIASWVHYIKSQHVDNIADPRAEELKQLANSNSEFDLEILKKTDIFGSKLMHSQAFEKSYKYWMCQLSNNSIENSLEEITQRV